VTPYLTEERLRVLGFVGDDDLENLSSAQIKSILVSASARVDAFCNVPKLPQPYSFRGGSIVDEEHDWSAGDALTPAQRRVFLRHRPIKAVSALRIYVTNTQYTDFDASELFVNKTIGAIEIVSFALTSSTPFGAFVLPNLGLQTPLAKVSYTYGYELAAVDEVLEPTDARTYRAVNQFWDDSDVTVAVNGAAANPGDYTVDRTEGTITFNSAQAADVVVSASYGYTLPQDIAMATGLIAHDMITEKQLHDKGMGNVRTLRVGEITIDRGRDLSSVQRDATMHIPPDAIVHLEPWRFISVR